ncbi:inorganic phosphate transporter [Streptomyces sp.]|uniref:inorganic phosphate transporter n=1 Tax=Streptomyces sp. TaxID=1931 RepID=UPI0035C6D4F3
MAKGDPATEITPVVLITVVGPASDSTNGFHDATNAIATSVSTRARTPRIALATDAVMNFLGAFPGTEAARTVDSGTIGAPEELSDPLLVMCALITTLGRRIVHLDPPRGFAAGTAATAVPYTTAFVFEAPSPPPSGHRRSRWRS